MVKAYDKKTLFTIMQRGEKQKQQQQQIDARHKEPNLSLCSTVYMKHFKKHNLMYYL